MPGVWITFVSNAEQSLRPSRYQQTSARPWHCICENRKQPRSNQLETKKQISSLSRFRKQHHVGVDDSPLREPKICVLEEKFTVAFQISISRNLR